ncbi:MAG: SMC-Scp complex subunit ScpB [Kiloniellaceae bacterium]
MTSETPEAEIPETEAPEAEAPEAEAPESEAGDSAAFDFDDLRLVEALLFAAAEPLAPAQLARFLPEGCDLDRLLADLEALYANRGVNLVRRGGRWAFRTAEDLSPRMELETKVTRKLSRVALETLAVIAYHQPVTRAEIEEIRGVALSKGTLDALLEIGWIRPKGRRRTPGRPVTWGTSESFLDHFGLESVDALPGVEELKAAGLLDARPALTALSDRGMLPAAGEVAQEIVEGEDDEDDSEIAEDSERDLLEETFGEDLLPQEVDLEAARETDAEAASERGGEAEAEAEAQPDDDLNDDLAADDDDDDEEDAGGDEAYGEVDVDEDDEDFDDAPEDDLRPHRQRSAG